MAAVTNPFDLPGQFYKGNLHTHTTQSDGQLSPEDTVALYRDRGAYDFLALSDHGRLTDRSAMTDENFVVLRGAEYHPCPNALGFDHHILCTGLTEEVPEERRRTVEDLVAAVSELGGVTFFAHPYWHGCTYSDLLEIDGPIGVEVFNSVCSMIGKPDSGIVWDDLLARGRKLLGIAVDDFHGAGPDYFGGWIMVRAADLTPDAILAAIKSGAFYASSGPEIRNVKLSADALCVECSPARQVRIISHGPHGAAFLAHGDDLIEGIEHDLSGLRGYFRVQVVGLDGRCAWTNPFYLDSEGKPVD